MQAQIADLVHPVIQHVLALSERLNAGETPHWSHEHAAIKNLLAALEDAGVGVDLSDVDSPAAQSRLARATVRYALTCWLDELLGQHAEWREQSMEAAIYGDVQGSRRFWEEAGYAETRGDRDALEVILWCVALGCSSTWRGKPETLRAWQVRISDLLDRTTPSWTMPVSRTPPPHERALPTDLPMRRMAFALMLGFALLVPLLAAVAMK